MAQLFYGSSKQIIMADDRNTPLDENLDEQEDRFESDTQKLTRKHLEDENHVITEEEIRNLRVGMTPPALDDATEARFDEDEEDATDRVEDKFIAREKEEDEKDSDKPGPKMTPWETIED
jgi:hypothetical protein